MTAQSYATQQVRGIQFREEALETNANSIKAGSHVKALNVLAVALVRELEALGKSPVKPDGCINLAVEVRRFEESLIRSALIRTGGRQRRAAIILGLKVTTLNAKIKRFGIDWEQFAGVSPEETANAVAHLRRVF